MPDTNAIASTLKMIKLVIDRAQPNAVDDAQLQSAIVNAIQAIWRRIELQMGDDPELVAVGDFIRGLPRHARQYLGD